MDEPAQNRPSDAPAELKPKPALTQLEAFPGPANLQTIFAGTGGLAPILRLLAYFGLREVLYTALGIAIFYAVGSSNLHLWGSLIDEVIFLAAAVVPALILAVPERRPFGAYGLPWRSAFGKLFWLGAVWGFAAITLLLLALHFIGDFDLGSPVLHGARVLKFAAFWGFFFLTVGFAEEFYLRGYTLFTLTQSIRFWPAAIVLSIVFGAIHYNNPGETAVGVVSAGLIGLFLCLTLRRTGNLWFAVGFHTTWDWGESYFYSVPDSGQMSPGHLMKSYLHGPAWLTGGSAGPEGSLLLFVLFALLWIGFDRVYRAPKKVAKAA